MKKVAIVYWSGTGNTAAMAQLVKKGVIEGGAAPTILEELEPDEFEPMVADCEKQLKGRTVGLFGSYEWNEGEWMETWQERTEADGANVVGTVIAYDYPDAAAEEECIGLGKDVVEALG